MDIDGVDRVGKMVQRWRGQSMLVVLCGTEGKGKAILSAAAWVKDMSAEGLVVANAATGYQLLIDLRIAEAASTSQAEEEEVETSPFLGSPRGASKTSKKTDAETEPVPYSRSP